MSDVPRAADVVVIGGGVHGASVAYHLARRGARRVVLVERKFLASGPTGRSSALVRRFYAMDFLMRTANGSADVFRHWAERVGGYAGVYDNTPDHEPVLGAVPEHPGLFVDFGWSGHGFKHAPAVGDILAQMVLDGHAPGWDLQPFRWSRFRDNALVPPAAATDPPH